MVQFLNDEDFQLRASLGFVKDYYKESDNNIVQPPQDYDLLLDMYENDPVLAAAIDTTVDVASSTGFHFEGKNSKVIDKLTDLFLHDLDFDMVLPNIVYSMLIYGDAFLEIRKKKGVPSELHALETTEMKIKYDEHGEVLGYVQESPSFPDKKVYFSVDEVIHIKMKSIGSRVYSYTPLKPVMRDYATKKYADHYLSSIFVNFPPRLLYVLKTANKDQTKNFIEILKKAKANPSKDLVGFGDIDLKQAGVFDFSKGLVDILNHLRTNILMLTKVPPIWLGIPDSSNRSNSEAQICSFESRVKSILKKVESEINKQLLGYMGYSRKNVTFRFNAFSLSEEKNIIENAKNLKEIGLDLDSVLEYLKTKGVSLSNKAKIEEQKENLLKQNNTDLKNNRGADTNGTGRKTVLDDKGVSEAGKKKREKQASNMRSASLPESSRYW